MCGNYGGDFTNTAPPVETVDVDVIIRGLFSVILELLPVEKKSQPFVLFPGMSRLQRTPFAHATKNKIHPSRI